MAEKNGDREKLAIDRLSRYPSCSLIVIDNFYRNPHETREYILQQPFFVTGNFPGKRTISYATEQIKQIIGDYIRPFGGEITRFHLPNEENSDQECYNGSFQITTSRDKSWVHTDSVDNWAGVLYLTPDSPLTAGTAFYEFKDNTRCKRDQDILDNKKDTDNFNQDMTKWKLVDRVGNVFNRLILFDSTRFHMSMDYFGSSLEDGRLFQVFFFSTERN